MQLTRIFISGCFFLSIWINLFQAQAASIWYVKESASGLNNGTSWSDALPKLETAISKANSGDQIWVATGNYQAPSAGYSMKEGVAIYGGFAGNETNSDNRSLADYPTVLNGGGGCVIYNNYTLSSTAILDGFTIQGGVASSNGGGGIYNSNASPTLRNLIIRNNSATGNFGGGVYNSNSSPSLINVLITGNSATNGAGVYSSPKSNPIFINVTITANNASSSGGGIYIKANSDTYLRNCIIYGNSAGNGKQCYIENCTINLYSCCFGNGTNDVILKNSNNSYINPDSYCINSDPLFANADIQDFRLQTTSPCIDKGDNSYNTSTYDIRGYGYTRIYNDKIDIGAYECIPSLNILYVKYDATGDNNGSNWKNAFNRLQDAISKIATGFQIRVARGSYTAPATEYTPGDNIAIYGGFAGNETATFNPDRRDFISYTTILNGGGGRVIHFNNVSSNTILDGFIIQGGNSGSSDGGGIYNNSSSPVIRNVIIRNNTAMGHTGGGIYNRDSSKPTLTNVVICNNTADKGAGIYNAGISSPILINVTIANNTATTSGGGIYNNTDCVLTNCILWNNSATQGNQIYISAGKTILYNCCYADYYRNAGYFVPNNSTTSDPLFVNAASYDYRLQSISPCVDAGADITFSSYDIRGYNNSRKVDRYTGNAGSIDIGAYEYNSLVGKIYVKATASGANNGSSWIDAFTSLQAALDVAVSGNEVWVATGAYFPSKIPASLPGASGSRYYSFQLKPGVALYGGFAGNEPITFNINTRRIKSNPALLNGDIGIKDNNNDNCFHVVNNTNATIDQSAVLDGFYLSGGNADNSADAFYSNYGGGILNVNATPTLRNLFISGNNASYGGGIAYLQAAADLKNCVIVKNNGSTGGGLYLSGTSNSSLINLTVANNQSTVSGGGIANSGRATLTNCILHGNTAPAGRQLYTGASGYTSIDYSAYPNNSSDNDIFTEPTASFSAGSHNVDLYYRSPNFKDPVKNNYELLLISPCLETGNSAVITLASDAKGSVRKYGSSIDIGAYQKWDGYTACDNKISLWHSDTSYSTSQFYSLFNIPAIKDTLEFMVQAATSWNMDNNTLSARWLELKDIVPGQPPIIINGIFTADSLLYACQFPKVSGERVAWNFFGIPFRSYLTQLDGAKIENTVRINKYEESIRATKGATRSAWIHMNSPYNVADPNSDPIANDYLEPGRGYALQLNSKVPDTTLGRTVIFPSSTAVTLNSDSKATTLSWTRGNNSWYDQGWNLIANPFAQTASVDISDSSWPFGSDNDVKSFAGGLYFYHSDEDNYEAIPAAIVNNPQHGLSPYGACFVKNDELHASGTISLSPFPSAKNPTRVSRFAVPAQETTSKPLLMEIDLKSPARTASTYIVFHSSAHPEVLPIEDSPVMSATTSILSITTTGQGSNLSLNINSLPVPNDTTDVPLQVNIPAAGSYNLAISPNSQFVCLLIRGSQTIDITKNDYAFQTTQATKETWQLRFINNRLLTANDLTNKNQPIIYANKHTIHIQSDEPLTKVSLYNSTGNLIRCMSNQPGHCLINVPQPGVYMIEMLTRTRVQTQKIVIK